MSEKQVADIAAAAKRRRLDGLIVSNTTLSRRGVEGLPHAEEAGGLSGRPLFALPTWALAAFRRALGADTPLFGAGGVDSAEAALAKIEAGADLVQLYTGLIYRGPRLPGEILAGLSARLEREDLSSLTMLRDRRVDEILARGPPEGRRRERTI